MKFTIIIETEDEQGLRNYINGPRIISALLGFEEAIRQKIRYSDEQTTDWESVRELFVEYCSEVLSEVE